ncbi:MAG: DUF1559 domain-containing protein [Planctomycetia bacterium]|nr:DUF1559 domain-containing protein [Planctomycetia bacterium]
MKNSKDIQKSGFTLVELLVVIAIIGILIGLLLPAVQAAREAARRMQCVNNLKQFGLAVHNFHDVRDGIPPAGVGQAASQNGFRASFWVLILPYMEQQNVFDLVSNKTAKFKNDTDNSNFWNKLSEEERRSLTVDGFFCPSRRAPTYLDGETPNNGQGGIWGPQGDYAFVVGTKRISRGAWFANQWREGSATNPIDLISIGPIRLAKRTTDNDSSSWYPRDNMSWWQDGTSNQIIIGEKFIPQDYIGKCDRLETDYTGAYCLDCSMYTLGAFWTGHAVSRSMFSCFAKGPNDYMFNTTTMVSNSWQEDGDGGQPHWGGTHAGVANFLLGDGSVRAFSNTTPTGYLYSNATTEAAGTTRNSIIGRLGHVCDGNPIPNL